VKDISSSWTYPKMQGHLGYGSDDESGQLVLAAGVALAFAILMIAGLTQIGTDMDADRDIEPSLGPEFVHVKGEFEKAVFYRYNVTKESAEESFVKSADMFTNMEFHYGLIVNFQIVNITGSPGDETVQYTISLRSQEQFFLEEGTIVLRQ